MTAQVLDPRFRLERGSITAVCNFCSPQRRRNPCESSLTIQSLIWGTTLPPFRLLSKGTCLSTTPQEIRRRIGLTGITTGWRQGDELRMLWTELFTPIDTFIA